MKTEDPRNLVEVSYSTGGKPLRAFAHADEISRRKAGGGGCVRLYKVDGQPQKYRYPDEFEWSHAMLAVGNIVEQGAPSLAAGWQQKVEASQAAFWAEFQMRRAATRALAQEGNA